MRDPMRPRIAVPIDAVPRALARVLAQRGGELVQAGGGGYEPALDLLTVPDDMVEALDVGRYAELPRYTLHGRTWRRQRPESAP